MNDIDSYNLDMRKSLLDKIFFADKVEATKFVDFGCADGSMIRFLSSVYPENKYFGYDCSQEMIDKATRQQKTDIATNQYFSTDIKEIKEIVNKTNGKDVAVIASSILHEIYHLKVQDTFWGDVLSMQPEYIVIRDMCVSRFVNRMSDSTIVARVYKSFDSDLLEMWERKWGNLYDNRSLIHFLLKYRFKTNWDTEFHENYLPFNYEELIRMLPDEYNIAYNEHYTLHFIKAQIMRDFGIDLQDRTHVKIILKRKH